MKTDLYTKAILTFIALFLGVLAFDKVYETAIPEAQAKTGKWECKELDDMGNINSPKGWDSFYANKAGWTFMTVNTYLNPTASGRLEFLFCGY